MVVPIKLLIIEDSPDDAELVVRALKRGGFDVAWRRTDTRDAYLHALEEESWDIIISDFAMPTFDGLSAFEILRERRDDIPFIFVSGAIGEERAVAAMRAGARDYLLKGNLARLPAAVDRELNEAAQRRARREAEAALARSEAAHRAIFELAPAALLELEPPDDVELQFGEGGALGEADLERLAAVVEQMRIVRANAAVVTLLGVDTAAALVGAVGEVAGGDMLARPLATLFRATAKGQLRTALEAELRTLDGATRIALLSFRPQSMRPRGPTIVVSLVDVTEQRHLEEQLRASQRMESLGRLAGGVAHDFNNLLTIIISFAEFLRRRVDDDSESRDDCEAILDAADRAATLTRQLLAFGRRQAQELEDVLLNDVIRALEKMLRRLLPESITLDLELGDAVRFIRVDPGQIEQLVLNLTVNAKDAMPQGGVLTLRTQRIELGWPEIQAKLLDVVPGAYYLLTASDTGAGMTSAVVQHIFEPFFTTKPDGLGTGLGLAMVHGIVRQGGGAIWVESQVGHGTVFEVYLPVAAGMPRALSTGWPTVSELLGSELVLLVEDNDMVRSATRRILVDHGYRVHEARDGIEALALATSDESVDLLVTDVVMPVMSGPELAERVLACRPDLRVLFVSGYTDNVLEAHGMLEGGSELLFKPFSSEGLLRRVRLLLDEPRQKH